MKRYLLDTNVHSEIARPRPDAKVLRWFAEHRGEWQLAAVALAERYAGAAKTGSAAVQQELDAMVAARPDLVAPFDAAAARAWGAYTTAAGRPQQPGGYYDRQIAATALARNLVVVTRNLDDFPGVPRVNPWTGEKADMPPREGEKRE